MKIKRVLSVFLAAALTVISAGCKKSKNNSASVGAALAQVSEQTGKFSYTVYAARMPQQRSAKRQRLCVPH